MAQEYTIEGDLVCLLIAAQYPFVLRQVNGHRIYISDACVEDYVWKGNRRAGAKRKFSPPMFEIH